MSKDSFAYFIEYLVLIGVRNIFKWIVSPQLNNKHWNY